MASSNNLAPVIAGCKSGDAGCFSQIVELYAGRCFGYFYRLTGNSDVSDELLSELFVKLVEKIGSYKGGAFESWLFRIATNIFHDYLRAKQRRKRLFESFDEERRELEPQAREPKKTEGEISDKLQVQLGKLDEATRELIMLRFYSELSIKEIAQVRSEPIGTTLSKLHRGLKRLRELME